MSRKKGGASFIAGSSPGNHAGRSASLSLSASAALPVPGNATSASSKTTRNPRRRSSRAGLLIAPSASRHASEHGQRSWHLERSKSRRSSSRPPAREGASVNDASSCRLPAERISGSPRFRRHAAATVSGPRARPGRTDTAAPAAPVLAGRADSDREGSPGGVAPSNLPRARTGSSTRRGRVPQRWRGTRSADAARRIAHRGGDTPSHRTGSWTYRSAPPRTPPSAPSRLDAPRQA